MMLLVGAGLFTRSLLNVTRVDLGLKVDNLVTFAVSPELNAYSHERSRAFFPQLEEKLRAPDVRQLRQRIALWARTHAITHEQTANYIAQRLLIAAGRRHVAIRGPFPELEEEIVNDHKDFW